MTSNEQHTGTPKSVTCPICGQQFTCAMSDACWCAGIVVPVEVRNYLAERYETCVCSSCLEALVQEGVGE